jgi:hypothetical protein
MVAARASAGPTDEWWCSAGALALLSKQEVSERIEGSLITRLRRFGASSTAARGGFAQLVFPALASTLDATFAG